MLLSNTASKFSLAKLYDETVYNTKFNPLDLTAV